VFITGDELEARIALNAADYADVAPRRVTTLPNIPLLIGVAALLMLGVVVVQAWWSGRGLLRRRSRDGVPSYTSRDGVPSYASRDGVPSYATEPSVGAQQRPLTALLSVLAAIAYVALLTTERLDYRLATFLFFASVGLLLARGNRRLYLPVVGAAGATALGVYALFTRVFFVDLP
jgi:hypothetical protein